MGRAAARAGWVGIACAGSLTAADLRVEQTAPSTRVVAGSSITFTAAITNAGSSAAQNVRLSIPLPARATFVSSTSTAGSCLVTNATLVCELGNLAADQTAAVALTFKVGLGTNQSVATVVADDPDSNPADNVSIQSVLGIVTPPAWVNGEATLLPELDPGPGSIYPLDIVVTSQTSRIDKVVVTLNNLTHFWPDDLDILLVGPGGNKVLLMSDCGIDNSFTDLTLRFDDEAAEFLPNSDPPITSGTYKPTNYDRLTDDLAAPAPPPPYVTNLAVFKGLSPNGTWSLYVMDDSPENLGYLADGWTLTLTLADPLADLALAAASSPASIIVGETLHYTLAVTNLGPAIAPTFVRDELPPGFTLVASTSSRGGCTQSNRVVICDFGSLAVGENASATLDFAPAVGGVFTNRLVVQTTQYDPRAANDSVDLITAVTPVAETAIAHLDGPGTILLGQTAVYHVTVTNAGPNVAARLVLTNTLPGSLSFLSATGAVGGCVVIAGALTCDFGPVPPDTSVTASLFLRASGLGVATNVFRVGSGELDFVPANNAASKVFQVLPAADMSIRTVSKRGQAVLEQTFVTEYAVSNAGPSTANVIVTNPLPPTVTALSATAAGGNCTIVAGLVRCDLTNLAAGVNSLITVSARGNALGTVNIAAGVDSTIADPVVTNDAVNNEIAIIPGTDLSLAVVESTTAVWLGEPVTYQLRITNSGPMTATAVQVTNLLPAGIEFISATMPAGVCAFNSGVVYCEMPTLARGSNVTVSVTGRAMVAGAGTNFASVSAIEFDPDLANNRVLTPGRVVVSSGVFSTVFPTTIPDMGGASPYPSTIFVAGLTASVYRVRVALTNLSHTFCDDLDILLVGPDGRSTYLMSDAGGEFGLNNAFLLFDDAAAPLPDSTAIFTGVVCPTNFDGTDTFPAPAPVAGYATNLLVFAGTDPNGLWQLYVMDDSNKDRGTLGGWSLSFSTLDPIADLKLTQTLNANPLAVGSNFVVTLRITNAGPATATDVRVTNVVNASLSGMTFTVSQGSCSLFSRQLVCSLGSVPSGGGAEVIFHGTPTRAEVATNIATVIARETDLRPADNTRSAVVEFADPPVILVQPASQMVTNGMPVTLAAEVAGSVPIAYQWFRNGVAVPNATARTLTFGFATPTNAGAYQLRMTNRVGFALSAVANLQVIGPPTISDLSEIRTDEDTSTPEIPFTVYDFETPAELIELTASSGDESIVPNSGIVFGGSSSNRTIRITPGRNAAGFLLIFLSARDTDGGLTTLPVPMTVRPINDVPTLSSFADQVAAEDQTMVLPFVAQDVENPADALHYQIVSSNPTVVASSGAVFEGADSNRVLRLTPVLNASGTSMVTVIVTDLEGLSVSNSFQAVLYAVNDPPALNPIEPLIVAEDSGPHSIPLLGISSGASNEIQQLQISASSSPPGILLPPVVSYQSPATSGTLIVTPAPNATGTSVVSVVITDGATSNHVFTRTFTVEVTPVNDPPALSRLADVVINEDTTVAMAVTVTDRDSTGSVTLEASAADETLVPASGFSFTGTDPDRAIQVTPAPDRSGTTLIRIVARDSEGLTATNEFQLTVTAVNDPPTLAALSDVTVREDSGSTPITLTGITAGPFESQPLVVTAQSSRPSIVPNPSVSYASPAATGTLTFAPVPQASGTAVITVTVDDGQPEHHAFSRTFVVTVTGTNDVPTASVIADQTMAEDTTNVVAVTIGDAETPADLLLLAVTSSNPSLLAATNVTFSGSGSNRFLRLAPRADQTGNATLTLRVSDGVATNVSTFAVTVSNVNDAPTLDPLSNLSVPTSPGNVSVPLTGIGSGGANENQTLTVTASTSNSSLFQFQPSVAYSSPSATGTLSFRPNNNSTGSAVINVQVSDGGSSNSTLVRSFTLTVRSGVNTVPTISLIPAQTINEDATSGPVPFTIRDAETPAGSLTLTAVSTNPELIPEANIILGTTGVGGTNRTITFNPVPNRSGTASIMLSVTDASFGSSNLTFGVTVNPVNDSPTIAGLQSLTILEDTSTGFLPFTVSDGETSAGLLTVTATSANPQLVPNNQIELGGAGATRSVRVSPLANQSGSAVITVAVSDGQASNSLAFTVTVTATNDAPVIGPIAAVVIDEDTSSSPVSFTAFDVETAGDALIYTVESSNPGLVDAAGLVLGGAGTNRDVTITPKANQFGTCLITIRTSDGDASSQTVFELTVNDVNDPPTLDDILPQLITADGAEHTVLLTGISSGATNETQPLALSAHILTPALISDVRIDHPAGSSNATLTYVPVIGALGSATIVVLVNDGQSFNNFAGRSLTVTFNQPPGIDYVPDVTTDEDVPPGAITLNVFDPDGTPEQVALTGFAADSTLIPGPLSFSGTGASRQLQLAPATNQFGATRIFVVATDSLGAISTNSFFLIVRSVIDPIEITVQPVDISAVVGASPGFTVAATSVLPLTYQWQFRGNDLAGETNQVLQLPAVQASQAGLYRALISSSDLSVLSREASLRVVLQPDAPRIVSVQKSGAETIVRFETTAGAAYTLEYKLSLSDSDWLPIGSVTGSGRVDSITDGAAADQSRFYRVHAN